MVRKGSTEAGDRHGIGLTEENYRRIVDHSPDAICVHENGRVVYVNAVAVRWMGYKSSEQMIGRSIGDFVDPMSIPAMLARITMLRDVGDSSEPSEVRMLRLDGTALAVEAVSVLTRWEGRVAFQVIFRDLTAQKNAEATLRHQAALINHVSDAIISTTATGQITSWNPAAQTIYGLPAERALALPISEVVNAPLDPLAIIASGGAEHATHLAADGSPRHVRVSAAAMDDGYVLVCSDFTALRRAEQHFETVVEALQEGVIVTTRDGHVKSVNSAARNMLGLSASYFSTDFLDRSMGFPIYNEQGDMIVRNRRLQSMPRIGRSFSNEVFGIDRRDGGRRWLRVSCQLRNPDDPEQQDILISFTDVTAERAAAEKLEREATHDPLTGLFNRACVLKRMDQALHADEAHALRAVLFIDIDGLKATNDTLGHLAGDDLLRTAAHRLTAAAGPSQLAGRLGGDEFVVLIFGYASSRAVQAAQRRIQNILAEPVDIADISMPIRASIGRVEVQPGDTRSATDILRDADAAMYQNKRSRRGTAQGRPDA